MKTFWLLIPVAASLFSCSAKDDDSGEATGGGEECRAELDRVPDTYPEFDPSTCSQETSNTCWTAYRTCLEADCSELLAHQRSECDGYSSTPEDPDGWEIYKACYPCAHQWYECYDKNC